MGWLKYGVAGAAGGAADAYQGLLKEQREDKRDKEAETRKQDIWEIQRNRIEEFDLKMQDKKHAQAMELQKAKSDADANKAKDEDFSVGPYKSQAELDKAINAGLKLAYNYSEQGFQDKTLMDFVRENMGKVDSIVRETGRSVSDVVSELTGEQEVKITEEQINNEIYESSKPEAAKLTGEKAGWLTRDEKDFAETGGSRDLYEEQQTKRISGDKRRMYDAAKAEIQRNPSRRNEIIDKLEKRGIPTTGL